MNNLPLARRSSDHELVRNDVVLAVRAAFYEISLVDLGSARLPSMDELQFTPVAPPSDPVMLGAL